jgi:hypothetical protein
MRMNGQNGNKTDDTDDPRTDHETQWIQVAQQHYKPDGSDELVSDIAIAIADAKEIDPTELKSPPLYECIDVEALEDTLFSQETATESTEGTGTIEFQYTDNLVKVRSDGWIQVFEPSHTDPK